MLYLHVNERSHILTILINQIYIFTMTKRQYIQMLERELIKLNQKIDKKILQGQSYLFESKRHSFLLKQIKKAQEREPSIFRRM